MINKNRDNYQNQYVDVDSIEQTLKNKKGK